MAGACVVRRLACALSLVALAAVGLSSKGWAGNTAYGYDALGRIVCVTGASGVTYDSQGRVTCVAGSNNSVTTIYNYDAAGNRTLQAVSVRPIAGVVYATVYENSNNNPITANITGGPATGVSISSGPTLGSASVGSNFTFLYTPQANSVAPDSFQYTASNANGSSDPATVFITIMQAPPTVGAVSQTVGLNCSGSIITPNVIGGGPASSVAISSGPSKGTVSVSGTLFVYTPNTSATNFTDTFQYTATNAAGTSAAAATVTLTVTSSVSCWGGFNWGTGVW